MRVLLCCCLLLLSTFIAAQSKREQAHDLAREAIRLMDGGSIDEAIRKLEEAEKLDPGTHLYYYEIGFAHQLRGDHKRAADFFRKAIKAGDATDQCYQMLGNVLDLGGDARKAHEAYDEGLKRFPRSGRLHMEKGTMAHQRQDYDEAIRCYERGIEAEPAYPTNYHRLALLFLSSDEEVWGMIYGELFMNLERNSPRTAEISKLLLDTYRSEITFPTDTSAHVSFTKRQTYLDINDLGQDGKPRLPFGFMGYELPLLVACSMERAIDLESLDRIRTHFLEVRAQNGHDRAWPVALFDYQQRVKEAGHLSAYNHWILMKGDEPGFEAWHQEHQHEWDAFVEWFRSNQLRMTGENLFLRSRL